MFLSLDKRVEIKDIKIYEEDGAPIKIIGENGEMWLALTIQEAEKLSAQLSSAIQNLDIKRYKCNVCNMTFKKATERIEHAYQAHSDIQGNVNEPCKICGGNISCQGNEHHWSVECEDCGYLYSED